jgi:hypothetical protein
LRRSALRLVVQDAPARLRKQPGAVASKSGRRVALLSAAAAVVALLSCVGTAGQPLKASAAAPLLGLLQAPNSAVSMALLDPLSLGPVSPKVEVGEYHDAWSLSPDRSQLALGVSAPGRKGRIGILIIDLRAMRVVRRVETGIAAQALGWLAPRRVVASLQTGGTVLVDPRTGKVLRRWRDFSYPDASARTPRGLVMLFGGTNEALFGGSPVTPPGSIVPRLGVVDARGRLRSVPLERIRLTVRPRLYSADRAGLAVDRSRARAYVFAANAPAAIVDLRTMRVSYRPVALGPRGGANRKVLARDRRALWLGDGQVVVLGLDLLRPAGRERFPSIPAGATLVDTANWRTRLLDPMADRAVFAAGLLLTYRSRGAARSGLRMYTLDGRRVLSLLDGERVVDVQVARGSAYVRTPSAVYVLDAISRKIVNKIVPPVELVEVIAGSS